MDSANWEKIIKGYQRLQVRTRPEQKEKDIPYGDDSMDLKTYIACLCVSYLIWPEERDKFGTDDIGQLMDEVDSNVKTEEDDNYEDEWISMKTEGLYIAGRIIQEVLIPYLEQLKEYKENRRGRFVAAILYFAECRTKGMANKLLRRTGMGYGKRLMQLAIRYNEMMDDAEGLLEWDE